MKKLKLNLDSLRVDSFQTAAAADARGTVEGFATLPRNSCGCPIYTDGCSVGCPVTGPDCGPVSNNCWTTIEN